MRLIPTTQGEVFSMIFMAVYTGCELVPFYQALSDNELFAAWGIGGFKKEITTSPNVSRLPFF
jgi:hypothetical protein